MQGSPRRGETAALAAMGLGLAVAAGFLGAAGRGAGGAGARLAAVGRGPAAPPASPAAAGGGPGAAGAPPVLLPVVRALGPRPRLSAGPDGVDVRSWTRARHLPWRGLRIHVRINRRLGFRSRTLELDTASGPDDEGILVVLGRWDLGADPDDVAVALHGLRPAVD